MINVKLTIKFIIAILIVSSVYYLFGIQTEQRIALGDCGYVSVQSNVIEVHSDCEVTVENGVIPNVEMDGNLIFLTIPNNWSWRIIP